jgi:hypothetical protein
LLEHHFGKPNGIRICGISPGHGPFVLVEPNAKMLLKMLSQGWIGGIKTGGFHVKDSIRSTIISNGGESGDLFFRCKSKLELSTGCFR